MRLSGKWVPWVAGAAGLGVAALFQSSPRWIPALARSNDVKKESPIGFLASLVVLVFIGARAVFRADEPGRETSITEY